MKMNTRWIYHSLLIVLMVWITGHNALAQTQSPGPQVTRVVSGTITTIDLQSRIIVVGGNYIHLPPEGKVLRKIGEDARVSVIEKNGRKTFVGFLPLNAGSPRQ